MKKLITLLIAMALCVGIHAQNPFSGRFNVPRKEFNPEQYRKDMREFVIREAKLTDTEAAKFFPLLEEMHTKQYTLMQQQREWMQKGRKGVCLSEADYEKIITQTTSIDVEMRKLEQTYFKKFHTVLSWQKVYAVRLALNRFQMEALKHFNPGRGRPQDSEMRWHEPKMGGKKF